MNDIGARRTSNSFSFFQLQLEKNQAPDTNRQGSTSRGRSSGASCRGLGLVGNTPFLCGANQLPLNPIFCEPRNSESRSGECQADDFEFEGSLEKQIKQEIS